MSLHIKKHTFAAVSFCALAAPALIVSALYINKAEPTSAASNCNILAKTIAEAKCMQDMNDEVLTSMVMERQYELKDARDGKMYYIAKLADGNVWMTQNLDFDLDEDVTLTPDDTDIKNRWTPNGSTVWFDDFVDEYYGGGGEGGDNPEKNASQLSNESAGDYVQYSVDVGDLYWNGIPTILPESDSDDVTEAVPEYEIENTLPSGDRHYHLGNYYNWVAAVASDDGTEFTDEYGSADQSICPAGWTLPSSELLSSGKGSRKAASNEDKIPSFRGLAEYYMTYDEEYGELVWNNPPYEAPLFLNYSGWNMDGVSYGGALWTREYESFGAVEGPGPLVPLNSTEEVSNAGRDPLVGFALRYNDDYADVRERSAYDTLIPIRCVARSREAIEANWIQGDEHEVESEEEGILKIEAPDEDGEIVILMIDDEPVSEDSGISIDYDDEEGGFVVTFPSGYLDTLEEGEHVVQATFTSGRSAYARLTVSSTAVPHTGAPDTGKFTGDGGMSVEEKVTTTLVASLAIGISVMIGMMPVVRDRVEKLIKK